MGKPSESNAHCNSGEYLLVIADVDLGGRTAQLFRSYCCFGVAAVGRGCISHRGRADRVAEKMRLECTLREIIRIYFSQHVQHFVYV